MTVEFVGIPGVVHEWFSLDIRNLGRVLEVTTCGLQFLPEPGGIPRPYWMNRCGGNAPVTCVSCVAGVLNGMLA